MKTKLMKAVEEFEAEMNAYTRDAEAEITRLRRKCEWRSMDTAPETDEWFLAVSANGVVVEIIRRGPPEDGLPYTWVPAGNQHKYYIPRQFTHWMPLPMPPNAGNNRHKPATRAQCPN